MTKTRADYCKVQIEKYYLMLKVTPVSDYRKREMLQGMINSYEDEYKFYGGDNVCENNQ